MCSFHDWTVLLKKNNHGLLNKNSCVRYVKLSLRVNGFGAGDYKRSSKQDRLPHCFLFSTRNYTVRPSWWTQHTCCIKKSSQNSPQNSLLPDGHLSAGRCYLHRPQGEQISVLNQSWSLHAVIPTWKARHPPQEQWWRGCCVHSQTIFKNGIWSTL